MDCLLRLGLNAAHEETVEPCFFNCMSKCSPAGHLFRALLAAVAGVFVWLTADCLRSDHLPRTTSDANGKFIRARPSAHGSAADLMLPALQRVRPTMDTSPPGSPPRPRRPGGSG